MKPSHIMHDMVMTCSITCSYIREEIKEKQKKKRSGYQCMDNISLLKQSHTNSHFIKLYISHRMCKLKDLH